MMYPVLLHGDGREKKMNCGLQFAQLLQEHPKSTRNWLNAAAKNLVDLHADIVKPFKVGHNVILKYLTMKEMQWVPAITKLSKLAVS